MAMLVASDCERNWMLLRRRDWSFWIYGLPKGAQGSQNRLQPGSLGWITGKMVLFKQRRKPRSQAATALQRLDSKTIPPSIHLLILPPSLGLGRQVNTETHVDLLCVFRVWEVREAPVGMEASPAKIWSLQDWPDLSQSCQSELPDGAGNPEYNFGCSDLEWGLSGRSQTL